MLFDICILVLVCVFVVLIMFRILTGFVCYFICAFLCSFEYLFLMIILLRYVSLVDIRLVGIDIFSLFVIETGCNMQLSLLNEQAKFLLDSRHVLNKWTWPVLGVVNPHVESWGILAIKLDQISGKRPIKNSWKQIWLY